MLTSLLEKRADGLRLALLSLYRAGAGLPDAVKGYEREQFVHYFLADVFPPGFRFGTGAIVDRAGKVSGQIDVVVEFPFFSSLPVGGGRSSRLYFAESVAAAIEIKSNVAAQWRDLEQTANSLSPLRRTFSNGPNSKSELSRIPLFGVGFDGWQKKETVRGHVDETAVDGILVLNPGIFVSKAGPYSHQPDRRAYTAKPASALVAFLACLHRAITAVNTTEIKLDSYITWVAPKGQRKIKRVRLRRPKKR
jgi:hypothetical protein